MQLTVETRSQRPRAPGEPTPDAQDGGHASIRRACDVACVAPFELRHALLFLQRFPPSAGDQAIERGVLTKAIVVAGRVLGVRVFQPRGAGGELAPKLRVALVSDREVDEATAAAALDRIAFFLGAGDDLSGFRAAAAGDPQFLEIERRLRGFHHVKFATPFEAACWAVLHPRIGTAGARRMRDALVARLGPAIDLEEGTFRAFPEPAAVADLGDQGLAGLIGHERKARAVAGVARAFATVGDDFLRGAPLSDVEAWLRAIRGVGPLAASYVLFRGLGRFDTRPDAPGVAHLARAICGRAPMGDDLAAMARRYGPWAGYWMLYVWASAFAPASSA
jgi:DNA-3-methyladenine glycosylase II